MAASALRQRAGEWIESSPIQRFIIAIIVINAITLGMQTSAAITEKYGSMLELADQVILSIFVFEIAVKLFAFRLNFFKNSWNNFDFIIVGIALIPASGPLAVLRALRILRVLRMISMIPRLRFVVEALLAAIPGISSIGALMLIVFYVFAVMATSLFGEAFPEWFGNIGGSMYTLFQVMTLESWSMGIVRPVMEVYPYSWIFFIPFILLATFTMLNLFIGIIVDTMQTMHEAEHKETQDHIEGVMHEEAEEIDHHVIALKDEIAALRGEIQQFLAEKK